MPRLKTALTQFTSTPLDWIKSVASPYVKATKVSLDLYLKNLCNLDGNWMN